MNMDQRDKVARMLLRSMATTDVPKLVKSHEELRAQLYRLLSFVSRVQDFFCIEHGDTPELLDRTLMELGKLRGSLIACQSAFKFRGGTIARLMEERDTGTTCRQFADSLGHDQAFTMGIPMTDEPLEQWLKRREVKP